MERSDGADAGRDRGHAAAEDAGAGGRDRGLTRRQRRSKAFTAVVQPVVYDKHGNPVAQYDARGRLSANWVRLQHSHAIQREAATMVLLSFVCSCTP